MDSYFGGPGCQNVPSRSGDASIDPPVPKSRRMLIRTIMDALNVTTIPTINRNADGTRTYFSKSFIWFDTGTTNADIVEAIMNARM